MMNLDPKDRASLVAFASEVRGIHGDAVVAVTLTGEAASAGYRPRKTPLTTVVVLEKVDADALRRTRPRLRAWRRRRIPTPLMMDPLYIQSALDVFPLEFLEIGDHHQSLWGSSDPFENLAVDLSHLRLQVEEQLRGKMLHLWEAYLEAGASRRALRRLLLETMPGFAMILRGLLRLHQGEADGAEARPDACEALLAAVERAFGVALPTFHRLETVRQGQASLASGELEACFDGYLGEVRTLVRTTDAL
jgi:hypothetical protein